MRILVVTNLFPNPYQPLRAPFNLLQISALAGEHQVAVIAPIAWTDEWAARRSGAIALPVDRRVPRGRMSVSHPRYLFPPKSLRRLYGRCMRWSIESAFRRAVDELAPDVVLACWAYPDGWAAVELGRRMGLPVVVKVHGSDVLAHRADSGRWMRTAEGLARADAVVAVSEDLGKRVVALGADARHVHVVPNGIDGDRFSPGDRFEARRRVGITTGEPVVLFVGNLLLSKGAAVLIDACARLRDRKVSFRCCLVGGGKDEAALRTQVAHHGLGAVVTLPGPTSQERLVDWYRAADVVALPSFSEGIPNVLREAMACGRRFVATAVGGIPEIAGPDVGRLVEPGDVAGLADALAAELSAPVDVEPAAARRRNITWRQSADLLAGLLQDAVDAYAAKADRRETAAHRDP